MRLDPAKTALVEAEIAHLRGLDRDGLRVRWKSATGRSAPGHLPKGLLLRMLAYRLQADVHGDLDPATVRFIGRIISDETVSPANLPLPDGEIVRPGTLLVREWEGVTHRVMALGEGYAWNGATYTSLSEVARAITGTRWNGPRFFGLRRRAGR